MATIPEMSYTIKFNGKNISLGESVRASFKDGFNTVSGTATSTNVSLNWFEIRVTEADEDWGIDKGNRLFITVGSIEANTAYNWNFTITPDKFNMGNSTNKAFRIAFYSRSALDGTWNITYTLLDLQSLSLIDSNGVSLEVPTQEEPLPNIN